MIYPKLIAVGSLLFFLISLSGCDATSYPAPKELAEANELIQDQSYSAEVTLSYINDTVILAYESDILFQGQVSQWKGEARVLYKQVTFVQGCESFTSSEGSWKKWRSAFAKTETVSPAIQIAQWLELVSDGEGRLIQSQILASDISDAFPDSVGLVYLVVLDDIRVNWAGLCDADIDTLFGGAGLLETAGVCKVTMLFRQETKELAGIFISAMEGYAALEGAILLSCSDPFSGIEKPGSTQIVEDAPLGEEWEMPGV